jgi:hypothetical protein
MALDYTVPENQRQTRRRWLPLAVLLGCSTVWYWPRLTPTGFPNLFDQLMLGVLIIGAFAVGYLCKVPGWVLLVYGGLGVSFFLLANLNDNNFRGNTRPEDIMVRWSVYVASGAIATRVLAVLGRRAAT